MPFKYERKTIRYFLSPPDALKRAAKCVAEEGMFCQMAAANFNVDKMTLMRHMKKKEKPHLYYWLSSYHSKQSNFFAGGGTTVTISHCALG